MNEYTSTIAKQLSLTAKNVDATLALLEEGATIPFISRYRKEATGSLDEVAIADIASLHTQLVELHKRRNAILSSLQERELLTKELEAAIAAADTMASLEDIYLPFKQKRRTRAMVAKERGLTPLADVLFEQHQNSNPEKEAAKFVSSDKEVPDVAAALSGARDILAERINEDSATRQVMRMMFKHKGVIKSKAAKGKEEEGKTYKDYFDCTEPIAKAPSHRLLAMFRGEREGMLSLTVRPDEDMAIGALKKHFIKNNSPSAKQVELALEDSYKRLLAPSMENETRAALKERADAKAISVFADNLRELLLAAPLGQKRVLALDPGFRTGAKLVCLDATGALLHYDTIFPTTGGAKMDAAASTVRNLVSKYSIEAIAIGNGTASRETESFVRELGLPNEISIVMVNESGASVYSASAVARKEFPDHDVTVRGAVSIGRRLMDPLAELVKIDPKSIGVGQYQHDVDQTALKASLDSVVESCVNSVGVELNTASAELLTAVSGLGPTLAENVVAYRNENGSFSSRKELLKVKRLGPKAYEQCAGFLRILGAQNPLDASAVHPESYAVVTAMAKDAGTTVAKLMADKSLQQQIDIRKYITEKIGLPTLQDIMQELARPGRDPRPEFAPFAFDDSVHTPSDLTIGMELPGIVTNVTQFGAFVDIGVHQDGLVHISQLTDSYVSDPAQVVRVQQEVRVKVLDVDTTRNRISLSMKNVQQP